MIESLAPAPIDHSTYSRDRGSDVDILRVIYFVLNAAILHKRFSAADVGGVMNVAVAPNNVDEVDFVTVRVRVELEANSVALDVECMLIEGVMTTMIRQIDVDCRSSIAKSEKKTE